MAILMILATILAYFGAAVVLISDLELEMKIWAAYSVGFLH